MLAITITLTKLKLNLIALCFLIVYGFNYLKEHGLV